ncbi:MAG: Asp-tRNA(Asn)/Glu-tRNA(Gln) amidotransferase subunit GatA [Oscillospiraceae bacterium]|nr:Asp-tRNA(Asn)/Glu-tRNA(Gln) amidotransferase subunit GatA [Oscillospiraceae bacterium]
MELFEHSASELLEMLRAGTCSSEEITRSIFRRISELEPSLNAYISLSEESALETARQVDRNRAIQIDESPLAGIPIAIKDNICTKGIKTTCASRMLQNFIPPYHATVMERITNAELPVIGKLNMDEFAMGSSTETSFFAQTRNPHDLNRVPGGSSGGAAAAIASGEAIFALGSDTGGSIRQPAAYCGIVGLKPTYGTVSRYGLIAFASSLDQIGPMARTVSDCALLYQLICGKDPRDATSLSSNFHWNLPSLPSVKNLRIGIPSQFFGDGVEKEVCAAVLRGAEYYQSQGAELTEVSLPSVHHALSAYYIISSAEASSNLSRYDGVKYGYRADNPADLQDLYCRSRSEGFGQEVQRRIILGTFALSSGYYEAYYRRAQALRRKLRQEFDEAFQRCDMLLTPTAPDVAFPLGERRNDPLKMYAGDICTIPASMAGLPALSIPCGYSTEGLPIGMQLIGPTFSERLLLETAYFYEQTSGLKEIRPVFRSCGGKEGTK